MEFHIWHYAESETAHLTAWREAANLAISALRCDSPLAYLCALSLNASPESHTQLCFGPPSSCCPLRLTTHLPDHYAQSNRGGFDCCYTFIFTPELYFPLSCFPNSQETLLIKVIPQCCLCRHAAATCWLPSKTGFEPLKTILMVCWSWWSNVTSRPFHAGENLILGTWVFSQAELSEISVFIRTGYLFGNTKM